MDLETEITRLEGIAEDALALCTAKRMVKSDSLLILETEKAAQDLKDICAKVRFQDYFKLEDSVNYKVLASKLEVNTNQLFRI